MYSSATYVGRLGRVGSPVSSRVGSLVGGDRYVSRGGTGLTEGCEVDGSEVDVRGERYAEGLLACSLVLSNARSSEGSAIGSPGMSCEVSMLGTSNDGVGTSGGSEIVCPLFLAMLEVNESV